MRFRNIEISKYRNIALWIPAVFLLLLPFTVRALVGPPSQPVEPLGVRDIEYAERTGGFGSNAGGLFSGLTTCYSSGICTLCDFFAVIKNAVDLLLGIVGAVALGFLLWNAFGMITARGEPEAIKASREGVWKLAVGLFFLLLSWELVMLVLLIMSGGSITTPPWQNIVCQ